VVAFIADQQQRIEPARNQLQYDTDAKRAHQHMTHAANDDARHCDKPGFAPANQRATEHVRHVQARQHHHCQHDDREQA